jgi:iron complex transport system substrate-binding protein
MIIYDQVGRKLNFDEKPISIVSCVPSITEYLYAIGCETDVKGRTKFCIHPKEKVIQALKIGGTKNLNLEKIKSLNPDLIIANKEENTQSDIEILEQFSNVYISNVTTIEEALKMMSDIATVMNKMDEFIHLQNILKKKIVELDFHKPVKSCIYLIWQDPYMTVGGDTFINTMLKIAGYQNVFENAIRYPIISDLQKAANGVDFILLSSEPYPFKDKHIKLLKSEIKNIDVKLIDGAYLSWYGSRMVEAMDYLKQIKLQH